MRTSEIQDLVIKLLSSVRLDEDARYCQGLTKRQILDRIEGVLAPNQNPQIVSKVMERVDEQLRVLEQDFEIIHTGDARKIYSMAPPSLIISREEPLLAQYVGDRAYLKLVIELINGKGAFGSNQIGSLKSIQEARDILEPRGISVQTENMLFQSVQNPGPPTEVELSMAEEVPLEDIGGSIEVYVPRRADFLANRWSDPERELPSAQSNLYRVKLKSYRTRSSSYMYLWKARNVFIRLVEQQAFRAMYGIDLEKNAARLLDFVDNIPIEIKWQLPRDYQRLISRYTEEYDGQLRTKVGGDERDFKKQRLRIRPKYRRLITELLEGKLGINKPIN